MSLSENVWWASDGYKILVREDPRSGRRSALMQACTQDDRDKTFAIEENDRGEWTCGNAVSHLKESTTEKIIWTYLTGGKSNTWTRHPPEEHPALGATDFDWFQKCILKDPVRPNSYTLVLDLDETLVYTRDKPPRLRIRPFVREFLSEMKRLGFEVVIWTSANKEYADVCLDSIDPNGCLMDHRLYGDSCIKEDYLNHKGDPQKSKDLRRLGRDLNWTLIIDDSEVFVKRQPNNCFIIKRWTGDAQDNELQKFALLLCELQRTGEKVPEFIQAQIGMQQRSAAPFATAQQRNIAQFACGQEMAQMGMQPLVGYIGFHVAPVVVVEPPVGYIGTHDAPVVVVEPRVGYIGSHVAPVVVDEPPVGYIGSHVAPVVVVEPPVGYIGSHVAPGVVVECSLRDGNAMVRVDVRDF